jgi:hypothetical protein
VKKQTFSGPMEAEVTEEKNKVRLEEKRLRLLTGQFHPKETRPDATEIKKKQGAYKFGTS